MPATPDLAPCGGNEFIGASEEVLDERNVQDLPAGDYVRVFVTDTGLGTDAETLARAVEPFYTTKGVGRGTGLGLPMVHGVAARSGGRLTLKSAKGEGTTAEIWLPRDTCETTKAKGQSEPAAVATGHLTILIVDDDTLVLRNSAVALEDVGHDAIEAPSGQAALEATRGPAGDRCCRDGLPHAGNERAAARRTCSRNRPEMPILLASAYGDLSSSDLKLPRLQKPFTQRELLQAIAALLDAGQRSTNVHVLRRRQP
jgi:CheY-like chemotaxis protein